MTLVTFGSTLTLLLAALMAIKTCIGIAPGCPEHTKLLPRYTEYRHRCEAEAGDTGQDPKWPCFTMWYGDLGSVKATLPDKSDPDDFFLLKNGDKLDFTTRDPKKLFTLSWFFDDLSMAYDNFREEDGCYQITLKHSLDTSRRIWVSDDRGKDRDIDTQHHSETSKVLCTKWAHIHVKEGN